MCTHSPDSSHLLTRRSALVSAGLLTASAIPLLRLAGQTSKAASLPNASHPSPPISVPDYERLAHERMSHAAWEFITSGCADDVVVKWNREALMRLRLEPRVLVDVSRVATNITLLGRDLPHPILLAPTAAHMLVHPEGEVETARGAGAASAILVVSTVANRSVEEIGRVATQPLWFQLYAENDRGATKELIQRAVGAGCQALCLTVDQPVVYTRDRVARLGSIGAQLPLGNLNRKGGFGKGETARTRSRAITWHDVEWFQSVAKIPVFLKGILHSADAEQAVKSGAGGIIVSNHGGRALDSVPASIDALPRVTECVAGRIPVLFDGGIRRGTDVLKALAFGATAVLIGRPYLFGLSVNGADGVRHVVEILRTELEAAMALTGRTSISALDSSVVWR